MHIVRMPLLQRRMSFCRRPAETRGEQALLLRKSINRQLRHLTLSSPGLYENVLLETDRSCGNNLNLSGCSSRRHSMTRGQRSRVPAESSRIKRVERNLAVALLPCQQNCPSAAKSAFAEQYVRFDALRRLSHFRVGGDRSRPTAFRPLDQKRSGECVLQMALWRRQAAPARRPTPLGATAVGRLTIKLDDAADCRPSRLHASGTALIRARSERAQPCPRPRPPPPTGLRGGRRGGERVVGRSADSG